VESVRRRVEAALPWFDVASWNVERARQAEVMRRADESHRNGQRAIADYRRLTAGRR
jgi:hypothetical protein